MTKGSSSKTRSKQVEAALEVKETRKQLKCNLKGFQRLVTTARDMGCMTWHHFALISQSPFSSLFWAFYEEKLTPAQFRRYDADLWKLVKCYNAENDFFEFGNLKAKLTSNDLKKVFQLDEVVAETVNAFDTNSVERETKFFRKHFGGKTDILVADIYEAFMKAVKVKNRVVAADTLCLMIMYLCASLFYPLTNSKLPRHIAKKCLNLDAVNSFDWAGDIVKFLIGSLKKKGASVNGCVLGIMYWFCDIIDITPPINGTTDQDPSFIKWNVGEFHLKMERYSIEDIVNSNSVSSDSFVNMEFEGLKEEIKRLNVENSKLKELLGGSALEIRELKMEIETLRKARKEDVHSARRGERADEPFVDVADQGVIADVMEEVHSESKAGQEDVHSPRRGETDGGPFVDVADEGKNVKAKDVNALIKEVLADVVEADVCGIGESSSKVDEHLKGNEAEVDDDFVDDVPSVPSRIKKIKNRTDRKPKVFPDMEKQIIVYMPQKEIVVTPAEPIRAVPPQKRRQHQKRVINVDDSTGRSRKRRTVNPLAKLIKKPVFTMLTKEDQEKLLLFGDNTSASDALWEDGSDAVGTVEISDLITLQFTATNVINGYLYILSRKEEHNQSYFASSIAWNEVLRGSEDGVRENLFLPMLKKWGNVQKVFFPIHIESLKHFTLLVVDRLTATSMIYDTLGTSESSPSYIAAKRMNDAVQDCLNQMRDNGETWKKGSSINYITKSGKRHFIEMTEDIVASIGASSTQLKLEIAKCPAQPGRSLDCGIAMLYITEELSKGSVLQTSVPATEFRKKMLTMRHNILRAFLNDGEKTWSLGGSLDLRKERQYFDLITQPPKRARTEFF